MFAADKQPLQAQLKLSSVRPAAHCAKIQSRKATALCQPGAYYHKYKHSNFISSSEYIVAVLCTNANVYNV